MLNIRKIITVLGAIVAMLFLVAIGADRMNYNDAALTIFLVGGLIITSMIILFSLWACCMFIV